MGLSIVEHTQLCDSIKEDVSKISDDDLKRVCRSRRTASDVVSIIEKEQARRIGIDIPSIPTVSKKSKPKEVDDFVPCGICEGKKEIVKVKRKTKYSLTTCYSCSGTGLSAIAFDDKGVQIKPGMSVKHYPMLTGYNYSDVSESGNLNSKAGKPIKTKSYRGRVVTVTKEKSGLCVKVFLLTEKADAKRHGFRHSRPENLRVVTNKTIHEKRLDQYKEKKNARKSTGTSRRK